jgi:hypothetical protein
MVYSPEEIDAIAAKVEAVDPALAEEVREALEDQEEEIAALEAAIEEESA